MYYKPRLFRNDTFIRHTIRYAIGFVCYHIWLNLPDRIAHGAIGFGMLPYVGYYGYHPSDRNGRLWWHPEPQRIVNNYAVWP
jgi:hypothetical protein